MKILFPPGGTIQYFFVPVVLSTVDCLAPQTWSTPSPKNGQTSARQKSVNNSPNRLCIARGAETFILFCSSLLYQEDLLPNCFFSFFIVLHVFSLLFVVFQCFSSYFLIKAIQKSVNTRRIDYAQMVKFGKRRKKSIETVTPERFGQNLKAKRICSYFVVCFYVADNPLLDSFRQNWCMDNTSLSNRRVQIKKTESLPRLLLARFLTRLRSGGGARGADFGREEHCTALQGWKMMRKHNPPIRF